MIYKWVMCDVITVCVYVIIYLRVYDGVFVCISDRMSSACVVCIPICTRTVTIYGCTHIHSSVHFLEYIFTSIR